MLSFRKLRSFKLLSKILDIKKKRIIIVKPIGSPFRLECEITEEPIDIKILFGGRRLSFEPPYFHSILSTHTAGKFSNTTSRRGVCRHPEATLFFNLFSSMFFYERSGEIRNCSLETSVTDRSALFGHSLGQSVNQLLVRAV